MNSSTLELAGMGMFSVREELGGREKALIKEVELTPEQNYLPELLWIVDNQLN